ncbi:MAG: G1 family glutamic endopeptidase [Solirubrobacteraceae bacterium]
MSRRTIALAVTALAALVGAPVASANNAESTNWAGYAVHHSGVRFSRVTGTWTQPRATCTRGQATYSSAWVGLGGYDLDSRALEQIGTESDCTASGGSVSSAWYELVPAAAHAVKLTISPGDRVRAGVAVTGSEVTVTLTDLTRHRSFTKRLHPATVETTSAEWILEAPSVCSRSGSCHTLPLADFGSAGFTAAAARTTTGHRGSIEDRRWTTTRISLAATGRAFVSDPSGPAATAVPSSLSAQGSAFTVTYRGGTALTTPTAVPHTAFVAGDRLAHPDLSRR